MPNNILITPISASIQFSGSAANTIRLQVEESGSIAFYGSAGSLFGITDSLSGSLMSVNDISGLPILEVFSDDRIVMGTFNKNTLVVTGSRIGIDKANPTADLDISGSVFITGSLRMSSGGITGSLFGTSSWANNAISSSFATSASWAPSVGSGVTSITVSDGLSGGTITSTGTISLNTGSTHFLDGVKKELNTEGVISSSQQINTGSFSGSFTGTLIGTSSWASNAISSSFATTASAATSITFTPSTASFSTSASYALSASYAPSAGGSITSLTAGNGLTGGTITSTGTITLDTGSAHFLDGVKKELNTEGVISSSVQINTGSFTGSLTGTLIGTSSWANNAISSSFATSASFTTSASFAPTVATFPFTGNAVITGSLIITGSAGLTVSGSASFANDVIMNGVVRNRLNLSTQTTNYTLALGDEGRLIFMASGAANIVTVPSSSTVNFPIGAQVMLTQSGSGQTRFTSASTGVTLLSANSALKIANRYSAATLIKTDANAWYLFGDITV